jgi:hypothetical protein
VFLQNTPHYTLPSHQHLSAVTKKTKDSKPRDRGASGEERVLPQAASPSEGHPRGEESWIALCAQAAVEPDPKRLLELVSEINRLLDARKKRLAHEIGGKAVQ